MHTRTFDSILILIFLVLAVYSGNEVFFKSFYYPFSGGERISVGKLKGLENDVRKKSFDQLSWYPVTKTDSVFNNDFIFTDKNSKAKLEFLSGNEVTINEESLFKVIQEGENINLDIKKGFLWANLKNSAQALVIAIENKIYQIKSSNGRIKIDNTKGSKKTISVLDGDIKIKSGNVETLIKKGEQVTISQGKLERARLWPSSFGFKDGEEKYILSKKGLSLSLKHEDSVKAIEISKTQDFNKKQVVKTENNKITLPFNSQGLYYLKYVGAGKQNIASVNIKFEKKPLLEVMSTKAFSGVPVEFLWNGDSKNYLVDISGKKVTSNSNSYTQKFQEGNFIIRVKINDKQRPWALWSNPVEIRVNALPKQGPLKVEPVNNYEIFSYGPYDQVLKWDDEYNVGNYRVKVAQEEFEIGANSFMKTFNQSGSYAWNVAYQIDDQLIWGNDQRFHLFIDNDNAPLEQGKKVVLKRPGDKITFNWDGEVVGKENFLLEISSERNFSNIFFKKELKTNSLNRSFNKLGTYYWRTKVIDNTGNIRYAKPVKIIVTPPPPPPPPKLKRIKRKVKTSILKNRFFTLLSLLIDSAHAKSESITLDWEGVSDVQKYKVQVYKEDKLILDRETTKNFIQVEELGIGSYQWRVASIDFWGQVGEFSEFSELIIEKREKRIEHINLTSPYHRRVYKRKANVKLSWDEISNAKEYIVELSKDLSFKKVLKYKTKSTSINIKPWKYGKDFYWRVKGGKQKSKRRFFSLKEKKVAKKPFKEKSILEYFWMPQSTTRKVQLGFSEVKIDGNDLISFGLDYEKKKRHYILKANLFKSSGKVFDDLDYTETFLSASVGRRWNYLNYFIGVGAFRGSDYSIESEQVVEERKTKALLTLQGSVEFTSLRVRAFYEGLGITQFRVIIDKNFKLGSFPLQMGLGYRSLSFEDTTQTSLFLKVGSFL